MEGWIKLHRSLLDNSLWKCEPFTRGQAWVDLLLLANYEHSFFHKRGVKIVVERGQVARSEVELADRWSWSRTKVRKFLNDLEKEQQIIQAKSNVTQTLTIINYCLYQEKEQQAGQQKNSKKTAEKHIKEYKEYKEDISIIFESFRKEYPGTKRGFDIELENFIKKNQPEIVELLLPALNKEKEFKKRLQESGQFVPQWKNLSTWINQKCWEQEFPQLNGNSQPAKESAPNYYRELN